MDWNKERTHGRFVLATIVEPDQLEYHDGIKNYVYAIPLHALVLYKPWYFGNTRLVHYLAAMAATV